MTLNTVDLDPSKNPAVLDTATWDRANAWREVRRAGDAFQQVLEAALEGRALPRAAGTEPFAGSCAATGEGLAFLAGLGDGQQVFIEIGAANAASALGRPLGHLDLSCGKRLAAYPTDADVVDKFCAHFRPDKAPRAMGDTPRLGVGCRMTTAVWPGTFSAMSDRGFAANSIQNSVRELNLMDDILSGRPPITNYACGFGTIESGYTGSTFEGLWLSGVLAALQHDGPLNYGADADHIQLKRDPEGLDRARRTIDAAKYYSFYTLDVSDVLDYTTLADDGDAEEDRLARKIPDVGERRDVLAAHCRERRFGDKTYALSAADLGRFVGKYWDAFDALGDLCGFIRRLKQGRAFDLEFTIDEHPPEVGAFDCLTTAQELLFVLSEIERRGLPVTHIAPNIGVEKGVDYRCPDGLDGLERRVRAQFEIAEEFGVMLDIHSADDLTPAPREVLRKATGGRLHYKVSPMLQILFAEILQVFHPELFGRWWDDAMNYARREAEAGSHFARECLDAYEASDDRTPSRHHPVFHHYSFAFVGRRDEHGRFLHRHEFYSLSPAFYRACQDQTAAWLSGLADELF